MYVTVLGGFNAISSSKLINALPKLIRNLGKKKHSIKEARDSSLYPYHYENFENTELDCLSVSSGA